MTEPIDQLARRLLRDVLNGELKWTPDMRLRIATVAQAYASLAIVDELRRMNDGRDQFHREVLDLFAAVTKPDPGPCASRTPLITFDNGPLPQQRCTLRHGHEGMHESVEGSRWTDDGSLHSEQPAAAPDGQEGGKP